MIRTRLVHASLAGTFAALCLAASVCAAGSPEGAGGPGSPPDVKPPADAGAILVRVVSSATCVNTPPTIKLVEATALELGLNVAVVRQIAQTMPEAVQFRFFGSPTVQVDGLDLEEQMRSSSRYVLS